MVDPMYLLSRVIVTGLAVYAGLSLYLYVFQENYIYFPDLPSREVDASPTDAGLPFESLKIRTEDGEMLDGWFVPAPAGRGTLLYLHGNGGNIGHRVDIIRTFHSLGFGVLIFDYRGYGRSTGKPSEEGTYRDALAAWNYLTQERRIPAQHIVLYGESLGGSIAAWLAERHPPRALVIYAAFTSVPDMAKVLYPFLPTGLIARYRYDTRAALARVHSPLLILHSTEDEIIPYSHAQELLTIAPEPKKLVPLRGGHNDAIFVSGDIFEQALKEFLHQ